MALTYKYINKISVGAGGQSTIVFSSIPNTYTDLLVKLSVRSTAASTNSDLLITLNSQSGSAWLLVQGTGGGSGTGYVGNDNRLTTINADSTTSSIYTNSEIYIPNYNSSLQKPSIVRTVMENSSASAYSELVGQITALTSAVTSITLSLTSGNFMQYSTAYLYGIKNS